MQTVVVIPARLHSTRLQNKVIADLGGKPVIQHVFERACEARHIDEVYIATDHEEVIGACRKFTPNVIPTSPNHRSGTDRIIEAVTQIEAQYIINVQGDEPFIDAAIIDSLVEELKKGYSMVSAMTRFRSVEQLNNPNMVKVLVNKRLEALYFSRSVVPFPRDQEVDEGLLLSAYYRHLGIYGYSRSFLEGYAKLMDSIYEQAEKLEQLRALENGYSIKMVETQYQGVGIDTEDDLKNARRLINNNK